MELVSVGDCGGEGGTGSADRSLHTALYTKHLRFSHIDRLHTPRTAAGAAVTPPPPFPKKT